MGSLARSRVVGLVLAMAAALWLWWDGERPPSRSEPARESIGDERSSLGRRALDGDTVLVESGGEELRVRIFGIDSPERGQPFADVARRHLRALVEGQRLALDPIERDRLGRLVARLRLEDGRDVAGEMLDAGLAWHFARYSNDRDYAAAERRARDAKRGLWQDRDPIPPWEWRQAHPVQAR